MLISAEVEYVVKPLTLDRYCQKHRRFCVAEVSDVHVEFDTRGIREVNTGNGDHHFMFDDPWSTPKILIPDWLEVWISDHLSV